MDLLKLWEYRCRKLYGDRYDFRRNLIDWDYHMNLKRMDEKQIQKKLCDEGKGNGSSGGEGGTPSIIHSQHFRTWRLSGIAYAFGDRNYIMPNRSILSSVKSHLEQYKDR